MMVQEELVHEGPGKPAGQPSDASVSWQGRSCEELRTILSHGIVGGEQYFAAAAEIERRAREADLAESAEQIDVANRRERRILWMAALIAGVTILMILGARYL